MVSAATVACILYYFNEVLFKVVPNFEGFFQIASAALFIIVCFIMLVIASIVYAVKDAKNKSV